MKVSNIFFYALFGLLSIYTKGQELTPPIQNFSAKEYAAASQNWDVVVDEQGIIYVANTQGLLIYDGQRWELFPVKNSSIVRSVYAHEGRIYTGSYQEFGYWEADAKGEYYYTSLMDLFGEVTFQSEEFWEILAFEDALYFRSFGAIYKYEDNSIERVRNVISSEMLVYNDRLVIAVGTKGLHFLEADGELSLLPNQEDLMGKAIVDIEVKDGKLLVGTRDGLYTMDKSGAIAYPDAALNALLRKAELNHLLRFSEDELVIGTVKDGLIHYKESSGEISIYNRKKGLQNNTILGMARKEGKVWLALDNGLDVVNLNSPISFFRDGSGELGAVYDLAFHEEHLYLASNTGVYTIGEAGLEMIRGSEGHSWGMDIIGGDLYANHNTGTYRIENGGFIPISRRTGSFQIKEASEDTLLIASYNGLDVYEAITNEVHTLKKTDFPIKQLVFENESTLWAAHAYEGIYRIGLSSTIDSSSFVKKYRTGEVHGEANAKIYKINNQITAYINEEWYKYNAFMDTLVPFVEMEDFKYHRLLYDNEHMLWFINSDNTIKVTDLKNTSLAITPEMLEHRLVIGNERIVKESDTVYYITLQDGFARINIRDLHRSQEEEKVNVPLVQGFLDIQGRLDTANPIEVPFKRAKEIKILAGLPVSDAYASLHYELTGNDTLRGIVSNGVLQFQNLPHGDYQLKLFGVNSQGRTSDPATLDFQVLPPWYLSGFAKFGYFLLFLGMVGMIYWYNRRKLRKHRKALEERFEKEHEERKHRLEKENLLNEINLKRKELANSTMMAAKKNEVLMEIQGELSKDKHKFTNEYRLKHLMGKINKAVRNNDEWAVFETNFNELHEDFFKDLLEAYPQLGNKDLKLCSYLRMNLTSKEIAPLMGISVRGVEVQRYRLRKKLNLDGKENLTNFLITTF